MRIREGVAVFFIATIAVVAGSGAAQTTAPQAHADSPAAARAEMTALALPGAPPEGLFLDYLAVDRKGDRVWVPAGGTGNTVVIDAKTQKIHAIEKFPTKEVERRGRKFAVGPTSATIGDGFVYVGNRADSSICAINATTLERGACVTLPSSPDGVLFIAHAKEVWVTTPRDDSLAILDVANPATPKLAGSVKLEGRPEGYAVDDSLGFFYTNLEDKDRTLKIDVSSRKVTATWMPACGERGPRGLAMEPEGQLLMVACTDHVEVLDAGTDGKILSKLDTGDGVDDLDYLPSRRSVYAAASRAATLTVAHLDEKGVLRRTASVPTARGARNAVVTNDGTAYVGDGPEGKILVVKPVKGD